MTHTVHLLPRCIGGGPERSVVALAREASALGIEQRRTIVVLDPPVTPTMLMATRRAGIEVVTRWDHASLTALLGEADLVVLHFWNHPALYELLRGLELPAGRVLTMAHVLGTELPQVLTREIGLFGDLLVLTSEASRTSEGAQAAAANGIRVEVMPSILDRFRLEGFQPRPHDGVVVGYFGSLSAAKLHRRFVDLCAQVTHPDVRFVIYGSGGDPARLQADLDAAGLAGRAEVRGPVEDLRVAFAEMDLLGYPLEPATFATSDRTLREAMWVGLAPVVLDSSAPALLVEHGHSGLVVDESGYAAAIDRLAGDPALRQQLGAGAAEQARVRFDPSTDARRLLDLMAQCRALPRRRRSVLAGAGEPPSHGFVRSLGQLAGPFAVSAGLAHGDVEAADRAIAMSPPMVVTTEGGLIHHRNRHRHDPLLRLWSGLVAAASSDEALAADEFAAAASLGLADGRPERHAAGLGGGGR